MTPHLYRAPKDGLAKLAKVENLDITVDVSVHVLDRV